MPVLLLVGCGGDVRIVNTLTTEAFQAGSLDEPADVLFVVDDSASMSEEQARLASGVGAMLAVLGTAAEDIRFGVVSTDTEADAAGLLRGGVLVNGPNLEAELSGAMQVGTEGARREQGFQAAVLATDGRNGDFPRTDVRMEIVFFSDEDDRSEGGYDLWFDQLWARFDLRLRVHGVVGDLPSGCFSPDGAADAGERYVTLIEATGGYQESICAPDYAGLLERLGLDLSGVQDTFPLGNLPEVDTLIVEVDGVVVEPDRLTGWTYEPAPNAIVFHGPAVPANGARVLITYKRLVGGRPPEEEDTDVDTDTDDDTEAEG